MMKFNGFNCFFQRPVHPFHKRKHTIRLYCSSPCTLVSHEQFYWLNNFWDLAFNFESNQKYILNHIEVILCVCFYCSAQSVNTLQNNGLLKCWRWLIMMKFYCRCSYINTQVESVKYLSVCLLSVRYPFKGMLKQFAGGTAF